MLYTYSLNKNGQFKLVYNKGKSFADRYLVMYVFKNKKSFNRLGLSVSKKVGKSVTRNRVRRLIKESYRLLEKDGLLTGADIVVIARQPVVGLTFWEMRDSLKRLLTRHSLLDTKGRAGKNRDDRIV